MKEKPDHAMSAKEAKPEFFHPKLIPGFQVAYVVFHKPSGVSAALNLKGRLLVSTENHSVRSRIHKCISEYEESVFDPEALRVEVDTFMEAYDKKIAEEETKDKEEEFVPDEEGWVKVTRRGHRPVLPQTEAASLHVLRREKRKRARKELLNFYDWQHRETKTEHLAQLHKQHVQERHNVRQSPNKRENRVSGLCTHYSHRFSSSSEGKGRAKAKVNPGSSCSLPALIQWIDATLCRHLRQAGQNG
ncbi:Ribosomal RNA-processing protein 7-like A [Cricetulus griseus]|uniref:Ribosomal RNA-processing protein 7-like A n=1 Tax=Cricetulus griseus TaxID=10029 RepID=G3ILW5_CRIGR|nr:Ribosomal RNA-processing protein 7-like A [Cricetulus griseus]